MALPPLDFRYLFHIYDFTLNQDYIKKEEFGSVFYKTSFFYVILNKVKIIRLKGFKILNDRKRGSFQIRGIEGALPLTDELRIIHLMIIEKAGPKTVYCNHI